MYHDFYATPERAEATLLNPCPPYHGNYKPTTAVGPPNTQNTVYWAYSIFKLGQSRARRTSQTNRPMIVNAASSTKTCFASIQFTSKLVS